MCILNLEHNFMYYKLRINVYMYGLHTIVFFYIKNFIFNSTVSTLYLPNYVLQQ